MRHLGSVVRISANQQSPLPRLILTKDTFILHSVWHAANSSRSRGCLIVTVQMKVDCVSCRLLSEILLAVLPHSLSPSPELKAPISSPRCRCRCWPRLHPQCERVQGWGGEGAASQGHFQISLVGLSCGQEASWLTRRLFFLDMSAYKGHLSLL